MRRETQLHPCQCKTCWVPFAHPACTPARLPAYLAVANAQAGQAGEVPEEGGAAVTQLYPRQVPAGMNRARVGGHVKQHLQPHSVLPAVPYRLAG